MTEEIGWDFMAKYYINQKLSIGDYFAIKDENLEDVFIAEGNFFTFGKKIKIRTVQGEELLLIREKVFTFLSQFEFVVGDQIVGEMKRKLTFFKKNYEITSPNWQIQGDIWDHNYQILENGQVIASITKKWFRLMDAYEIDVQDPDSLELILGIVIAIDIDLLRDAQSN